MTLAKKGKTSGDIDLCVHLGVREQTEGRART